MIVLSCWWPFYPDPLRSLSTAQVLHSISHCWEQNNLTHGYFCYVAQSNVPFRPTEQA